jgi:hypothetical protein
VKPVAVAVGACLRCDVVKRTKEFIKLKMSPTDKRIERENNKDQSIQHREHTRRPQQKRLRLRNAREASSVAKEKRIQNTHTHTHNNN